MADELEAYFDNDDERVAYEAFCAEQERGSDGFTLDAPALVCRWRMANKHVPLLNRHIRALSQRRVNGEPLSHNMLSWAKQHVEWSLAEGSYADRNGVLMLVIDVNGNAAMTVGAYEPLPDVALGALIARAAQARAEAGETGVAPELLCAVTADGRLVLAAAADERACGAATLVEQLAATRGHAVARVLPASSGMEDAEAVMADAEDQFAAFRAAAGPGAAFFLVSDEHGVVPAAGNAADADPDAAAFAEFLAAGYRKLFS